MNDNELPDTAKWAAVFCGENRKSLRAALGVIAGLLDDPDAFDRCARAMRIRRPPEAIGTFSTVVGEICALHGVSWRDMVGREKTKRIAEPRHHAMYAAFVKCPHLSLGKLGVLFGGRDHTTIFNGISQHCLKIGITYEEARRAAGRPGAPPHFLSHRHTEDHHA